MVFLGSKHLVELQGEAIKMADVKRAEVVMEGIVEQLVIDGEVTRGLAGGLGRDGRRSINGS